MSDVYCFGHVSTGQIIRLKGRYPPPDGYAEIAETLENHAGEATGTALILAALNVSVTLEGNWIGDNPAGRRSLEFLASRGIDCSGLAVKPGYAGVNEIVISDGDTRTVFGRYIDLLFTTPQWESPRVDRIRSARIVCVDPSFGEATLLVARTAHAAGRPIVTCDARANAPLTGLADAIVISREFLLREYPGAAAPGKARELLFAAYLAHCPGLVVFTAGAHPLWYGRRGDAVPRELPSFAITVVDSAGAGDSFRGGLIYGFLRGWSDEDALEFAQAVAALICMTAPGCMHPPTLDQVSAFLGSRGITPPR